MTRQRKLGFPACRAYIIASPKVAYHDAEYCILIYDYRVFILQLLSLCIVITVSLYCNYRVFKISFIGNYIIKRHSSIIKAISLSSEERREARAVEAGRTPLWRETGSGVSVLPVSFCPLPHRHEELA